MSLPFLVRWEYGYTIKPGTPEAELYEILRTRLQIPKALVPSYSVISYGDAQFRLPRATTSV